MRLKIHRNEALESMARETVKIGMKHTSERMYGLMHRRRSAHQNNIITILGFLFHLQGHVLIIYTCNLSFKLYARFSSNGFSGDWEVWKINRNVKKLSNNSCKTYSPPGLRLLSQPPYTLAPIPLC